LKPNIEPYGFYIEAFNELHTCRNTGLGISPIPFSPIVEYAKVYAIDDFEEFLYLIRRMDNSYLTVMERKNNGTSTNKTNKNSSGCR